MSAITQEAAILLSRSDQAADDPKRTPFKPLNIIPAK